jgi:hypothetical protein
LQQRKTSKLESEIYNVKSQVSNTVSRVIALENKPEPEVPTFSDEVLKKIEILDNLPENFVSDIQEANEKITPIETTLEFVEKKLVIQDMKIIIKRDMNII